MKLNVLNLAYDKRIRRQYYKLQDDLYPLTLLTSVSIFGRVEFSQLYCVNLSLYFDYLKCKLIYLSMYVNVQPEQSKQIKDQENLYRSHKSEGNEGSEREKPQEDRRNIPVNVQ